MTAISCDGAGRLWQCRDKVLPFSGSPLIMGILNITPDSFSDGGESMSVSFALAKACRLIEDGADILDIGGMSTRPGYTEISVEEELSRVMPVLKALRDEFPCVPLSVDTFRVSVARCALDVGADIINDVAILVAGDSHEMYRTVADCGAGLVLMHSPEGLTRVNCDIGDGDICDVVTEELRCAAHVAVESGLQAQSIVLDPGIGFGKSSLQNLQLLSCGVRRLHCEGFPVLVGASRKRFLGEIAGVNDIESRIMPSVFVHMVSCACGAEVIRVHDVREHRQALDVLLPQFKGKNAADGI